MKNEIVKINPADFGLREKETKDLTKGLDVVLKERDLLITEFEEVSKLEITPINLPKFKELRLRIVKNRTQGISKWHTTAKDYFLKGGNFVDAIKRKEIAVNEMMEEKLKEAEKFFEIQEQKRLEALQIERVNLLSKYVEDANERDLSKFEDDEFEAFLNMKKKAYFDKIEAEKQAEKERIAKEKAEKEEQERIKKENERLKKEREEREKQLKLEAEKRAKLEAERIAKEQKEKQIREEKARKEKEAFELKLKKEREEKERIEKEARLRREKLEAELRAKEQKEHEEKEEKERLLQLELSKGDADKVNDLIKDLELLKTKYTFKSLKNKKMYANVNQLIDKVVTYIQK